jgi:hypothetical protein
MKFKLLPHPAYSPDIVSSIYHKNMVYMALCTTEICFTDGVGKLVNRCVEKLGDNIEE